MTQLTIQNLFQKSRTEWLEETRYIARQLLQDWQYITVDQVLAECPRPTYIHRNTTGQIFRHPDFKVYGFQKSRSPLARGRIICQWMLANPDFESDEDDDPPVREVPDIL